MNNLVIALTLMLLAFLPVTASETDPQTSLTTFCTPYDSGAAEKTVLDLIRGAHHKIRIIAYGYTDPKLNDEVIAAYDRGVDVAIVMDSTQAAGPHQKPLVNKLRRHGISVAIGKSEVHSQLIHCKAIIVDDAIVESGSWNFSDPTSSDQDNYLDIVCSEKRAEIFTEFFNKIQAHILTHK